MPLTPKYTWEQDEGSVSLTIALSSAAATRNARVECTDAMVKITCPPYFLQVLCPPCLLCCRGQGQSVHAEVDSESCTGFVASQL